MHASNKPQAPTAAALAALAAPLRELVLAVWRGASGWTVRCVPTRRTVRAAAGEAVVYAKWRRGRRRDAAAEWRWLHELPQLGMRTPLPLAWLARGSRSLLVTEAVDGRSLDAWAAQAHAEGWTAAMIWYACAVVAPAVRRLHDRGLVYRDLYWNHIVAGDPRHGGEPCFLDVERLQRPRWRWRRWLVKDLAGLLASAPEIGEPRAALRFARAYFGRRLREHRALLAAVERKAARIRGHRPRYG